MRVMIAVENRFLRTTNGNIYSTTGCNCKFWQRYLQVFDEVVVFARVADVSETELDKLPATGPGISFLPLPTFIGPWQFLKHYWRLKKLAGQATKQADAFILRAPGTMANLLWHQLRKQGIPYAVEVVGDPWDALKPGNIKSIFRPVSRPVFRRRLAQQCRSASVASYVTKFTLQKYYPPGCWSTHYSSVELPGKIIVDKSKVVERINSLNEVIERRRPLKICHIGSMAALYKGQDILIEAISLCRKKHYDIELTLLGQGRCYPYYLNKVEELNMTKCVSFPGQLPPGQPVIEQLDAADLFVLPSLAEGLPRCLIEAMARGLPCLASNIGGIPELLPPEALVPPGDATALAAKIESVIYNPDKMQKMSLQNIQTAKEYRMDELNRRRTDFYKRLKKITEDYISSQRH